MLVVKRQAHPYLTTDISQLVERGWIKLKGEIVATDQFIIVKLWDESGIKRYLCQRDYIEFVRLAFHGQLTLKASAPHPNKLRWPESWVGPAEDMTLEEMVQAMKAGKTIVGNPTVCRQGNQVFPKSHRRGFFFEELWSIGGALITRDPLGWEHFSTSDNPHIQKIVADETAAKTVWTKSQKINHELIDAILNGSRRPRKRNCSAGTPASSSKKRIRADSSKVSALSAA